MKDEINKIIQSISDFYKLDNALKYYLDRHKAQILLDYITNLQQKYEGAIFIGKELNKDNERANQYIDFYEDLTKQQINMINDYKSRNKKAVEYIKEHIRIDDEYPAYMEMLIEEKDELLNILQGGDEE